MNVAFPTFFFNITYCIKKISPANTAALLLFPKIYRHGTADQPSPATLKNKYNISQTQIKR